MSNDGSFNQRKQLLEYESVDLVNTFPEWKSPLLSVDYLYIQTFKELRSVQQKLEEKEKEIEFHNTEMTNDWKKLQNRQQEFIKDVKNCNKFFIENELKCERVHEKIQSEIEHQTNYKEEINDTEKRIIYLEKLEQEMSSSEFLHKIVEEIEHFTDVNNLINHFALLNSETNLQEKFSQNLSTGEKLRTNLLQNLKSKINVITEKKSECFQVQQEYQTKTSNLNQWKEKLIQQKNQCNYSIEENISVKLSCDNVFQKLCKWKKSNLGDDDIYKKLIFTKNTIDELQNAVQLAYEISYKNNISHKAEDSFISLKRII